MLFFFLGEMLMLFITFAFVNYLEVLGVDEVFIAQ
jgi:hypothetical protein